MRRTKNENHLFNKDFIILWHTQLISQFGSQAFSIGMIFWIKHATDSATLMGTLLMISMIPGAILGPLGGVISDNYSRKKIIVWSDLICAASVLSFAGLFLFIPDNTNALLISLFAVSIIVAISRSFFGPAVLAAIPDIVPIKKIKAANSISQSSNQLAGFISLGLGGVLYRILGGPLLFFIDGLSYLYSGLVQLLMIIPQELPKKNDDLKGRLVELKKSIFEGFNYIWERKGMRRSFMLISTLNFFYAPVIIALPFYVEDVLYLSTDWYGYILAAYSAGAIIGYLLINLINVPKMQRGHLMATLLILLSMSNYAMGMAQIPYLALIIALFSGVFLGYINVNIINQLQVNTGQEMRGRVFGNLNTLTAGIMPISFGLSGILIDAIDKHVGIIFKACGIITLLVTLLIAFNQDIYVFFAKEPEVEEGNVSEEIPFDSNSAI